MTSGHKLLLAWALSMAAVGFASAAEPSEEAITGNAFTLKGFGTLGLARSDNDHTQYVRDLSQPQGLTQDWSGEVDSVLGLQAGYRFSNPLEGILQVISRYHYDASFDPEVSLAFLRYEPNPNLNLRLGRLGTEFYMLADSRLVGYSNLTVRPPPDFYGPLVLSYFDGADVGLTTPIGNGLLRGKFFVGISPEKMSLKDDLYWDMSGSQVIGGHLDFLAGPWQVRIGETRVHFDKEVPINQITRFDIIAQVPEMSIADTWTRYDSLGVVYDDGPLQLQLMLNRIENESATFEDIKAGYAIASYRTGKVTPYLGYSMTRSEAYRFTNPSSPYVQAAAQLSAATHSDQHTWFLGARWDFRKDMDLKAQVDWIRGSPSSNFPFRGDSAPWDGHMTVFSLALDFVF